jgi:NADPH:quinone reductase-like Zn-dependent oxidoreductase
MKAIVYRTYGSPDVVRIEDVATPVPREREILVRNHASVVAGSDCEARKGDAPAARLYFGLRWVLMPSTSASPKTGR